jgi:lauroyl/myristoyl acyltransferase
MKLYDLYLLTVIGLIKMVDCCDFLGLKEFLARTVAFAAFHLSSRTVRLKELAVSRTLQFRGSELESMVKQSFYDFWHDVFAAQSHSRRQTSGHTHAQVRGMDHLKDALRKGRGVILWEGSFFGRRVLAKRILQQNGFPVCQVHSQYHIGGFHHSKTWISKHMIQPFFNNRERLYVRELISLSQPQSLVLARYFLERLRRNDIICISADGIVGVKFIPVPFFGRTVFFPTGIISVARLSGTTVLPLFCVQVDGQPTLIIEPAVPIDVTEDRERSSKNAAIHYMNLLESYIKAYPEQYRNWHGLAGCEAGGAASATAVPHYSGDKH